MAIQQADALLFPALKANPVSDRKAYYCGDWIAESELCLPVGDLGVTMGVTATERLRTFGGSLYRLDEHVARLSQSLKTIGLDSTGLAQEVKQAMQRYCELHRSHITVGDDWAVVAFVTPGSGAGPTVAVHGFPLRFGDWAERYDRGVRLQQSSHRQVPTNCWPAELKCRSRMHYYLADVEARQREAGSLALLLDQEGFVAETTTANLVVYNDRQELQTPRFANVLRGISIDVVEQLAQELRVSFAQADLSPQAVADADEVWITNTSICMQPVVALNGQPIGNGKPGPMFERFLKAWGHAVGVDIAEQARTFSTR